MSEVQLTPDGIRAQLPLLQPQVGSCHGVRKVVLTQNTWTGCVCCGVNNSSIRFRRDVYVFFFDRPFFAVEGVAGTGGNGTASAPDEKVIPPAPEMAMSVASSIAGISVAGSIAAFPSFCATPKTSIFSASQDWSSFFCRYPCVLNHCVNEPSISLSSHFLPDGASYDTLSL